MKTDRAVSPIEVHDLTVAYHHRPVLWDIDLTFPEGKLVAVVVLTTETSAKSAWGPVNSAANGTGPRQKPGKGQGSAVTEKPSSGNVSVTPPRLAVGSTGSRSTRKARNGLQGRRLLGTSGFASKSSDTSFDHARA